MSMPTSTANAGVKHVYTLPFALYGTVHVANVFGGLPSPPLPLQTRVTLSVR